MKLKYLLLGLALFVNHKVASMESEIVRVNQEEFTDFLFKSKTEHLDITKDSEFETKIDKDEKGSVRGEIKNGVLVLKCKDSALNNIMIDGIFNNRSFPQIPILQLLDTACICDAMVAYVHGMRLIYVFMESKDSNKVENELYEEQFKKIFKCDYSSYSGEIDPLKSRARCKSMFDEARKEILQSFMDHVLNLPYYAKQCVNAGFLTQDICTGINLSVTRTLINSIYHNVSKLYKTFPNIFDIKNFFDQIFQMDKEYVEIFPGYDAIGDFPFKKSKILYEYLNNQ